MRSRFVRPASFLALWILGPAVAVAQYQVGPVYPHNPNSQVPGGPGMLRSGQDPFQYNPWSGRFDYVPIPYEADPFGSPYRFNWHSGQWDYVPVPSGWNDDGSRYTGGAGAMWQDTRIDTRALQAGAQSPPPQMSEPPPVPGSRPVPAAVLIRPAPLAQPVSRQRQPTTAPSTEPSSPPAAWDEPPESDAAPAPIPERPPRGPSRGDVKPGQRG